VSAPARQRPDMRCVREPMRATYAHHMSDNLSEHVAENRRYWDAMADDWVILGERAWEHEARWGNGGSRTRSSLCSPMRCRGSGRSNSDVGPGACRRGWAKRFPSEQVWRIQKR